MLSDKTTEGSVIWVLRYGGPCRGTLERLFAKADKACVSFGEFLPEIVPAKDCYDSRRDCYLAACERAQTEASNSMAQAVGYSKEAMGYSKEAMKPDAAERISDGPYAAGGTRKPSPPPARPDH